LEQTTIDDYVGDMDAFVGYSAITTTILNFDMKYAIKEIQCELLKIQNERQIFRSFKFTNKDTSILKQQLLNQHISCRNIMLVNLYYRDNQQHVIMNLRYANDI